MAKNRSQLLDILSEQSVAKQILNRPLSDQGFDEAVRYPFLAIVGQEEMKLALLLSLINRQVGGVLLIGPRGTGKTTAVRGLVSILPIVRHSKCARGCDDNNGIDAVCPDCAVKMGQGEALTSIEPMRLIELPLNSRLEDVVGGINERIAIEQNRVVVERGVLSYADQNLLYIDEVNLLDDQITNAILDAAAQGRFMVRRGPMTASYRSRLFLIGSMNPEEGHLRPQLQDRFGLRVFVGALTETEDRLETYHRTTAYHRNPVQFYEEWEDHTDLTLQEIQIARERLPKVGFEDGVQETGIRWIQTLEIESHRAEVTLFEAGRAYAAADARDKVTIEDLRIVAPMALRQRRSEFMTSYIEGQQQENDKIAQILDEAT
ncbi:MAG: magnesium chelatase [Chloroflexota bacterium]